jgi:molybdenum cofactor cytidylyltransferase
MIAGLVLAAGASSRMGRDKALLLYRGQTFLDTIISTLRAGGIERIAVVLGHHADEIRRKTRLKGVEVVVNQQYQLGQTSSLQAALPLLDRPEIHAVLLCLVDHPAVSAETVRAMTDAFRPPLPAVLVPTYRGQRGHPVLIARELFPELRALAPGVGANAVTRKYLASGRLVRVGDRGILVDVDDSDTYHQLSK